LGNELLLLAVKDEKGYSWDSGLVSIGRASHNLLGFSHGAAGIGYSLLELYNQTKNKRFLDGAINAFKYENHWFNKDNDNWPDFRINTYQGDRQGKKKYTYPIKWCHGAPGIGFSRIRAYQILKENMYKSDVDAALRTSVKHIEDNQYYSGYVNNDYSLCHGLSGIADLLLFSDQTFRTNYRDMLLKIYQNANKENNIKKDAGSWRCGIPNGETPDLMVGLAGIGYMYLRLYAPDKVPSILCITADKC
jgi:lantibiotic modifying enzyme